MWWSWLQRRWLRKVAASTGGSFIRHVGREAKRIEEEKRRKNGGRAGSRRWGREEAADRKSHSGSASSLGSLYSVRNLSRFTHHISALTDPGEPPSTRGFSAVRSGAGGGRGVDKG